MIKVISFLWSRKKEPLFGPLLQKPWPKNGTDFSRPGAKSGRVCVQFPRGDLWRLDHHMCLAALNMPYSAKANPESDLLGRQHWVHGIFEELDRFGMCSMQRFYMQAE